jgi:hypothetical protein
VAGAVDGTFRSSAKRRGREGVNPRRQRKELQGLTKELSGNAPSPTAPPGLETTDGRNVSGLRAWRVLAGGFGVLAFIFNAFDQPDPKHFPSLRVLFAPSRLRGLFLVNSNPMAKPRHAHRLGAILLAIAALCITAPRARAQTDSRLMLDSWPTPRTWGATFDDMLYQGQSHIRGETVHGEDARAQIFWWDSIGRFRLGTADENAPRLAYRYITMNFDSDSKFLPKHLDQVSVATGLHLGELDDGNLSAILGAGYSGDNPFADSDGVFALAHLIWEKPLEDKNALVLSLDYDGISAFLPDIPLPGAQYIRRGDRLSYAIGFPRSSARIELLPALMLDASYDVPFTADLVLDYRLSPAWSIFGGYHNFYNAYRMNDRDLTDRLMVQMSRAEVGIHYTNPDFVLKGAFFDVSLALGYAFEQHYSSGFDVRDTDPLAQVSDVPYAALMLRGRF